VIEAVVFDMDGVLVDSEGLWNAAREQVTEESGGRWTNHAQRDMMGMSSLEWSKYMHEELGVSDSAEQINHEVVARMERLYRERLPLIPGAREAVERLSPKRLALASSANRPLIDLALELAGLAERFEVKVSSEEVARGKPAPDVYLEAAARLGLAPAACAAVEDSENGIRSARAAAMRVIAIPNAAFPPDGDVLAGADAVLDSIGELDLAVADGQE
jgi:HAD superfamily hydrolase (TIGR01509 family)